MKKITSILIAVVALFQINAAVVYVKRYASGSNNGTSWANAYTDLRIALASAASGSEIWISADTFYLPNGTARTAGFDITNKSLTLYGGFPNAGNPTSLSQRSPLVYKTILSGDIARNDAAFSTSTLKTDADRSDNAYSVMNISVNGAISYTIVIDGLTIQDGNAESASAGQAKWGAGIYFTKSVNGSSSASQNLTIRNCEFRYNTATEGAAVGYYFYFTNNSSSTITMVANRFHHNTSDDFPVFTGSISGTAGLTGLGVYFESNAVYRNKATSSNSGVIAAICNENQNASSSFGYNINFNTFSNNYCTGGLGLICLEGTGTFSNYAKAICTNNISYNDYPAKGFYNRAFKKLYKMDPLIDYNMFGVRDSFIIKYDGGHTLIGADPGYTQGFSDNYRLTDCAAAINSGSLTVYYKDGASSVTLNPTSTDVIGNTRVNKGKIDRGAYEYFENKFPTNSELTTYLCLGESTVFNGKNINTTGVYMDTLTNSMNCDSFITHNITIMDSLKIRMGVINNMLGVVPAGGGSYDSYEWYIDGVKVNGQTIYYIPLTTFGTYTCKVTKTRNGVLCTEVSPAYVYGNPAGVKDNSSVKITVYPNPVENTLRWNTTMAGRAKLVNMQGQVCAIQNSNESTIDVSKLSAGIYYLQFELSAQSIKVIKQ